MCKIGVFDSGKGGLTVLEELRIIMPLEDYVFLADFKHNPYGEKSDDELFEITSSIVDILINKGCKLIVIACNTATTRCIKYLREKYKDITFIGTEPAIKVACDRGFNNTLVMATPATINSERLNLLVEKNKKDGKNVFLVPCFGLAHAIEIDDVVREDKIISEIYEQYKDENIDAIVLGCTHYPYVKDIILKYFHNVTLLDGNHGVALETKRQLEKHGMMLNQGKGTVEFID